MARRLLMGILIIGLSLPPALAQAEDHLPFKATFSGILISTQFDTNGDGAPANYSTQEGQSNLGPFSLQVLDESVRAESTICPNGHEGYFLTLITGSSVFRFRRTGDLLFVRPTAQITCFDPSTGEIFFHGATGDITGGTGQFTNARGTLEGEGGGRIFIADPQGHVFGEQHGTITGEIILP
jgi:hypothetical protein